MPAAQGSGVCAVVILCAWQAGGDSTSAGGGRGMGSPQVAKEKRRGQALALGVGFVPLLGCQQ